MVFNSKFEGLACHIGSKEFPEDIQGEYVLYVKDNIKNLMLGGDIMNIINEIRKADIEEDSIKIFNGNFTVADAYNIEKEIRGFTSKAVITLSNGKEGIIFNYVPSAPDVHFFEICQNGKIKAYLDGYEFFSREFDSVNELSQFIEDGGRLRESEGYQINNSSYNAVNKIINKDGSICYYSVPNISSIRFSGKCDFKKEIMQYKNINYSEIDDGLEEAFLEAKERNQEILMDEKETYEAINSLKTKLDELGIKYREVRYKDNYHNHYYEIKVGNKFLVNAIYETYGSNSARYTVYNLKNHMIPSLLEDAKNIKKEAKEFGAMINKLSKEYNLPFGVTSLLYRGAEKNNFTIDGTIQEFVIFSQNFKGYIDGRADYNYAWDVLPENIKETLKDMPSKSLSPIGEYLRP